MKKAWIVLVNYGGIRKTLMPNGKNALIFSAKTYSGFPTYKEAKEAKEQLLKVYHVVNIVEIDIL